MTKPTRGRFTGDLAKPLPPHALLNDEERKKRPGEIKRRMELLRDHYRVPEGDWLLLAYLLAREVVPGLREARGRPGAPTKWMEGALIDLMLRVDQELAANPRWSVARACQKIVKSENWQLYRDPISSKTLERRYHDCTPELRALWKEFCDSSRR